MLKLHNTFTGQTAEFHSLETGVAKIYSCGPTVYGPAHIGNFRAFIFADLLKRAAAAAGFAVKHVMNITDVGHLTGDRDMGEDKLTATAAKERKTAWEIASYYTEAFLSDTKELNIVLPDKLPRATDHIQEMIGLIEILEARGFTYKTSDGIYFDTAKFPGYGKLAHLNIEGLKEGARVEVNKEKKNPTDFALWKFSPRGAKRDMEWSSPWGLGFPGWHIECSAMSVKYLGQPFDIHTGGVDHIPVHHTNEIAQTEAATGRPLANVWMHSEFVMVEDGRMGKSEGNAITLQEIKHKGYSPLAYRYFVLQGHYRSKLNFTWDALRGAQNALDNLYAAAAEAAGAKIGCAEFEERFFAAINDDLDTPKALAIMWEMMKSGYPAEAKLASLLKFDKVLGLSVKENVEELQKPLPDEIKKLIAEREKARRDQDWEKADKIRKAIEEKGFKVRDSEKGSLISRV